jgi:hypothetical protein
MSLEPVTTPQAPVVPHKRRHPVRTWAARLANGLKRARGDMTTRRQRLLGHLEALFVDHSVFRLVWSNRFPVSDRMWRSNQPCGTARPT